MTWVAVGVVGVSAAVGAGGSIYSGMVQSDAAKRSAGLMSDANMNAEAGLDARMRQSLSLLAPFLHLGRQSGDTLARLSVSPAERQRQTQIERSRLQSEVERLSVGGNWADFPNLTGPMASERKATMFQDQEYGRKQELAKAQAALNAFDKETEAGNAISDQPIEASPLYQWQLEQGTKYMDRSLAKKGLSKSGEGMKVLGDFVRGLGAEESDRQYGRLMGLYSTGASAASGSASVLGAFAPQIAGTQIGQGTARANGVMGSGEATANMIAGVTNSMTSAIGIGLQYNQMNQLINRNSMAAKPALQQPF